jgi:hypothetical protein
MADPELAPQLLLSFVTVEHQAGIQADSRLTAGSELLVM